MSVSAVMNTRECEQDRYKKIERNKERKIHHYDRKGERGSLECTLHFCARASSATLGLGKMETGRRRRIDPTTFNERYWIEDNELRKSVMNRWLLTELVGLD
ncbi:hypothetical protein PV325_012917 [Microctonus aethiopoides]|nr:hypothetical protein PV325_012917 [Microctonus aethiopoides]KAK0093959.1 hypothetical protein PV326_012245 [Microctonus aethiopoides]